MSPVMKIVPPGLGANSAPTRSFDTELVEFANFFGCELEILRGQPAPEAGSSRGGRIDTGLPAVGWARWREPLEQHSRLRAVSDATKGGEVEHVWA